MIPELKQRIFGDPHFSIEEILESLTSEQKQQSAIFTPEKTLPLEVLANTELLVEKREEKLILYEVEKDLYLVYQKEERPEEDEKTYDLFVPTGVTVRRVPQNILGNGVLGRAFIHSNYIEILDSLIGNEYQEVLTHEVLHIMYPEKKEIEIRQMTRNYMGQTVYN